MVHLTPIKHKAHDPSKRYFHGRAFRVVPVKRHIINPTIFTRGITLWRASTESLMERYPWPIAEEVWTWLVDKYTQFQIPRFSVALSTGKDVSIPIKKPKQEAWVMMTTKKAQK